MGRKPGPQRVIYHEAIQVDAVNRIHLHLSCVVYGSGTASLKGMTRDSFTRGTHRRTYWIPRRNLNPT